MAWPAEAGSIASFSGRLIGAKRRRLRSRIITIVPMKRRLRSCVASPVPIKNRSYSSYKTAWRISNTPEYRFYRRLGAPPSSDQAPFATASSLPSSPTVTFDDGVWFISVSYFNGLLDSGFLPIGDNGAPYSKLEIISGDQYASRPKGPFSIKLVQKASGVVRVIAFYTQAGTNRASQWAIAYTDNGSAPATDSPDATVTMSTGGIQVLEYDLPAKSHGTTIKVRVQTRRNDGTISVPDWVYSSDSYVVTTTADAQGPTDVIGLSRIMGLEPESL